MADAVVTWSTPSVLVNATVSGTAVYLFPWYDFKKLTPSAPIEQWFTRCSISDISLGITAANIQYGTTAVDPVRIPAGRFNKEIHLVGVSRFVDDESYGGGISIAFYPTFGDGILYGEHDATFTLDILQCPVPYYDSSIADGIELNHPNQKTYEWAWENFL